MLSTMIAVYALFCILVFFIVNVLLRKQKNKSDRTKPLASAMPKQKDTLVEEKKEAKELTQAVEENKQEGAEEIPAPKKAAPKLAADPALNIRLVLLVLILGMFFSILNQTVINVALPDLMNEFNVSTSTIQWLSTGFMLVNGILVPISAYLIQTFTYRRLFLIAIGFFTVGSIICAISGNFPMMLTGRLVQAVGAGILMPTGMNIFMTLFPPEKRGAAMGLLGVALILGPAVGPTIAGWLIQNYTWKIMFYAMFAIGAVIFLMAIRWFKLVQPLSKPKLDVTGVIFSTIGFGSLLYALSEAGNKGWDSTEVDAMLAIGVIGLIVFVWWELKAETKLLDLTIFKIPAFSFTIIINFIITMALYGGMILLPVYLQNIRGFSPLDSGLLLLPGSLIMGLMGPFAGKLFDRYGIRPLAIFGLILMTFGTYELSKLTLDTPYATIVGIYIMRSFGMAFISMPIMTAGMNALPLKQISHGTASQNTLRSIAGSIGTAILVTFMTRQTTFHAADYASAITSTNPIMNQNITQMGQSIAAVANVSPQTGSSLGTAALYGQVMKVSSVNGINDAFLIAAILAGVALVLSIFLPPGNKPNRG
ncbi:DHA2 family efflux MFS transporter permease subunit [Ectobacillus polymachus]|uniref:DHA2 family efflux MFS transporter permease subunit n=1 Tax=Ectobacillus polymachus TaxID=1508806 RepID=UPI003A8BD1B2